jgi:hypothetical protein
MSKPFDTTARLDGATFIPPAMTAPGAHRTPRERRLRSGRGQIGWHVSFAPIQYHRMISSICGSIHLATRGFP